MNDERDDEALSEQSGDQGDSEGVRFHLEIDGVNARLGVRVVSLNEEVSTPYACHVETLIDGDVPELGGLLGRGFELRIERGGDVRTIRGLIRHTSLSHPPEGTALTLQLVPSIWRLGLGSDTRSYLDLTVPELVKKVLDERLGSAVKVDASRLKHSYERHEFLLQYQESAWNFISRWMEQEGIFFFTVESDADEEIVLCDSMNNLPLVRGSDAAIPYWVDDDRRRPREAVFDFQHWRELGTTNVAVGDYDWTHPSLSVRAKRPMTSPLDPAPELFEHADVVSFHRYGGEQYQLNTAERAALVRAEALALENDLWSLAGTVVTAAPGHILRIEGSVLEPDVESAYMIMRSTSVGTTTEGQTGSWQSNYAIVPRSKQYRRSPSTRRPVAPGPETARVVGPSGQEIETDRHGRVKVRFHWDRQREREEMGGSPWIRVSQSWAGAGFGTFFVPRIGMEVVVSFLGGDPERPLITGCVYNGENHARVDLPADKTQSVIRTKSSLNSDGFNELRFEDASGSELVYMHAQRDLLKKVLHDRTVDVGNDESVHVHHDRRAEVDGKEHVEVHGQRRKIQHAGERETFHSSLVTSHGGDRRTTHARHTTYAERIRGKHEVVYTGEDGGVAHEVKYETGDGVVTELLDATSSLTKIEGTGAFQVRSADLSVLLSLLADEGTAGMKGSQMVGLKTTDGSSKVELTPGFVDVATDTCEIAATAQIKLEAGGSAITIDGSGVWITAGSTTVGISPSGVTIVAPTTTVVGSAFSVLAGAVSRGGPPTWT